MKKKYFYLVLMFMPILAMAQVDELNQMERQTNEGNQFSLDSIKTIIPTSKQSLLKDVDVIFNTRMAFDNYFDKIKYLNLIICF